VQLADLDDASSNEDSCAILVPALSPVLNSESAAPVLFKIIHRGVLCMHPMVLTQHQVLRMHVMVLTPHKNRCPLPNNLLQMNHWHQILELVTSLMLPRVLCSQDQDLLRTLLRFLLLMQGGKIQQLQHRFVLGLLNSSKGKLHDHRQNGLVPDFVMTFGVLVFIGMVPFTMVCMLVLVSL
jgi:hypothetical protein